jgi:acetylornithine deacetylase/succinyl-diaminopimelate desuccinylase-like protein/gamma-glutamyl:cysteine ligase YbdK (ATP-grasp superfamily)
MLYDPAQFAEKYKLALQSASKDKPAGGLNGFELEWNLLDEQFRPLLTVGSGPARQSFVDYLRAECLPPWLQTFSQLEVFHWMVEFATRPYYSPRGAIYEARLLEAVLANALARAGDQFGERLFYWHGNLLFLTEINHDSIPGNWGIAKRRYLERCVDLYNTTLATAGIHVNLSLPDPLFTWDFMHLPEAERTNRHLDQYKSEFYITSTRLLRAWASLFIATSASTPLQAQVRGGRAVVVLTENDSVRNLTFPNPPEIDLPNLYRSYKDYKAVSYDLVQRGIRFGNNNWTPVRARSFAEPVERLISTTGDQLKDLYTRGLYSIGETTPAEEMARQIEKQNLLARINLPMGRVEIRTDDGGHPLDIDVANMTLKHLLLIRFYADDKFARSFRYDHEDISRARANELIAARDGLRSEIENPLTGKPIGMRAFLKWTLDELRPLAESLNMWEDLSPLVEMAAGAPNTAEKMRARLKMELGANDEITPSVMRELAEEREEQVRADLEKITNRLGLLGDETEKIGELLQHARQEARTHPELPYRFRPVVETVADTDYADKTAEILDLSQRLIRFPSVTACPDERLDEVHRAGTFIHDYLKSHGLEVRYFDGKYPAVLANFPGGGPGAKGKKSSTGNILLTGHFDVVEPEPDDSQFQPSIEGDYLKGRGSADMKTVVATYLVWMKDTLRAGKPYPDISLLLVGNEENGESEAWGTPQVLNLLKQEHGYSPSFFIAGERTGEKGTELFGEICIENRGVMRFDVVARGAKAHSGVAGSGDLSDKLIAARAALNEIFSQHLTLKSPDGWQSQAKFPFIKVGTPGVYNVTAAHGILGVEIRPIPQDDTSALKLAVDAYCAENGLEVVYSVMENGVACDPQNPALLALIDAVRTVSGQEPRIGRKLPGTSARFAPGGQAVVWGQTGIGPHAKNEQHYIPSIEPYYKSLNELAKRAH